MTAAKKAPAAKAPAKKRGLGRGLEALLGPKRGEPLISRAIAGQFPPGSTFKISSLAAAVADGYSLKGIYPCPGSYNVDSRAFTNFRSTPYPPMTLHRAIVVSCDTIF